MDCCTIRSKRISAIAQREKKLEGRKTVSDRYKKQIAEDVQAIRENLPTGTGTVSGSGLSKADTTDAVKSAIETASTNGISIVRTPAITITDTSGTVPEGCKSLSMAVSGSAAVTILGVSVPAGITLDFPIPSQDKLGEISYDATGSQLIILEVR